MEMLKKESLNFLVTVTTSLAFQQKTRDEFKRVILRAKDAYERVSEHNRCKARASYSKYFAEDACDERLRIIINECLPSARDLVGCTNFRKRRTNPITGIRRIDGVSACRLLSVFGETTAGGDS